MLLHHFILKCNCFKGCFIGNTSSKIVFKDPLYLQGSTHPHNIWSSALQFAPMLTSKILPFPPLCSSKSHKYNNYIKALYIVSSYLQFPHPNLFARLFTCPQAQLTPHISINTPSKTF